MKREKSFHEINGITMLRELISYSQSARAGRLQGQASRQKVFEGSKGGYRVSHALASGKIAESIGA